MIYSSIAKVEMLAGGKISMIRIRLVSHLFCCWVEILNIKKWQILFLFPIFGQTFTFTSLLTKTNASSSKRFMRWCLEKRELVYFNVITSSLVKSNLSCTSHIKSTTCLPIVYFLLCLRQNDYDHHDKTKSCVVQLSHLNKHSNYQHNNE
jgi:hypothetical protein